MESSWEGGTKVYVNGPGHMTKMAAMPIYGKNLLKIFSRTRSPIYDLETWHAASGTAYINDDYQFYGKVKLVHDGFDTF